MGKNISCVIYPWDNVLGGQFSSRQLCRQQIIPKTIFLRGSFEGGYCQGAIIFVVIVREQSSWEQLSGGKLSSGAIVRGGNFPRGQLSPGAIVQGAIVRGTIIEGTIFREGIVRTSNHWCFNFLFELPSIEISLICSYLLKVSAWLFLKRCSY